MWSHNASSTIHSVSNCILTDLRLKKALKVYEKTGSVTVLQQVMGHADLKTSLTYLKGLEIQQLEVISMPQLY